MSGKIATRNAYGKILAELGAKYPKLVVLDADLSNATMSKFFAAEFPDRFFNMGIAECNMVGVAAGLAAAGLKPFTNTFAMFAAGRAYEQVRNSVAYPGLNVICVGTHGGVSVGEDGATHQCVEDLALMRAIPGMTVIHPCDGYETEQAVEALLNFDGPAYLRLSRPNTPIFTDELEGYKFEIGKGVTIRDGADVTLVATGLMVYKAMEAAELLAAEGVSARVLDIHTIKPLDCELICKAAKETGALVTCEEHNIIGGLGGAVAECVSGCCPVPVVRVGVEDQFGRSGKADECLAYFGLTPENIAAKAKAAIALKK